MDESELQAARAALEVDAAAGVEAVKRAYLRKSYALIRSGAAEPERERLKRQHEGLLAQLEAGAHEARSPAAAQARSGSPPPAHPAAVPAYVPPAEKPNPLDPTSFDSAWVNAIYPPAVAALAVAATVSPFGFLLQGFHVWVHEFGHATAAWMTGRRALPLPIGWTNLAPERSHFVYFGILLLLGLLFGAGVKERKIWPMLIAIPLAIVQYYMTWRLPPETGRMWGVFGGTGGQFYLSAAMIAFFYVQFPAKFRWGACRHLFVFLGASSLFATVARWRRIKYGQEPIPYGSMVNGEEDAGGDMDTLTADFDWTDRELIATFNELGQACLWTLFAVYLVFVLRLDRIPGRFLREWKAGDA